MSLASNTAAPRQSDFFSRKNKTTQNQPSDVNIDPYEFCCRYSRAHEQNIPTIHTATPRQLDFFSLKDESDRKGPADENIDPYRFCRTSNDPQSTRDSNVSRFFPDTGTAATATSRELNVNAAPYKPTCGDELENLCLPAAASSLRSAQHSSPRKDAEGSLMLDSSTFSIYHKSDLRRLLPAAASQAHTQCDNIHAPGSQAEDGLAPAEGVSQRAVQPSLIDVLYQPAANLQPSLRDILDLRSADSHTQHHRTGFPRNTRITHAPRSSVFETAGSGRVHSPGSQAYHMHGSTMAHMHGSGMDYSPGSPAEDARAILNTQTILDTRTPVHTRRGSFEDFLEALPEELRFEVRRQQQLQATALVSSQFTDYTMCHVWCTAHADWYPNCFVPCTLTALLPYTMTTLIMHSDCCATYSDTLYSDHAL